MLVSYPIAPVKRLVPKDYRILIDLAFQEDAGKLGDITSDTLVALSKGAEGLSPADAGLSPADAGLSPADAGLSDAADSLCKEADPAAACIVSREAGVFCGKDIVQEISRRERFAVTFVKQDGEHFQPNECVCELSGTFSTLLRCERILLNFLQYLSSIAGNAHVAVQKAGQRLRILDTRKTLPGYRRLAKYAVYCGGGTNHRSTLDEMILVKDNHWKYLENQTKSDSQLLHKMTLYLAALRAKFPKIPITIEIETIAQLDCILACPQKVDVLILDNMDIALLRECLQKIVHVTNVASSSVPSQVPVDASSSAPSQVSLVELSGSLSSNKIEQLLTELKIAEPMCLFASMGSLTHTVRAVDMSFQISQNS